MFSNYDISITLKEMTSMLAYESIHLHKIVSAF